MESSADVQPKQQLAPNGLRQMHRDPHTVIFAGPHWRMQAFLASAVQAYPDATMTASMTFTYTRRRFTVSVVLRRVPSNLHVA